LADLVSLGSDQWQYSWVTKLADPFEEIIFGLPLLGFIAFAPLQTVTDSAQGELVERTPQQAKDKHQVAIHQILGGGRQLSANGMGVAADRTFSTDANQPNLKIVLDEFDGLRTVFDFLYAIGRFHLEWPN